MNAWPLASSPPQPAWTWPITLERYDQKPALTDEERETLAAFVDRDQQGRPKRWSAQTKAKLDRLWKPLQDILEALSGKQAVPHTVSHVLIKEMHQRQVSFWGWSEQQWGETLECSVAAFVHTHGCDPYGRQDLMIIAYVLGKLTFLKGWAPQEMQRERVARKVFGNDRIDSAVERIYRIVVESRKEWGYSLTNRHRVIGMAVCWAFLVNRNPHLEAISLALLEALRELTRDARMVAGLFHLARALAELHMIERGLASASHTQPVWTRRETAGIAPVWIEWCHRWYQGATGLAHTTKGGYLGTLFIVGRWLASVHPEITSPHQWTSQIAAEWVQVVDTMKVGDWASKERVPAKSIGKPISPRSKVQHLAALKTFFRDLQEEPFHLPRTLNPYHAFRIPQAISRLIGPDPRDIDARWWAMIVQAALDLTEADLPSSNRAYPLELVRALAIAWVYSGVRSNELVRLRTGCIRWQHEEVTIAETGERVSGAAFCFLTVPVNKTYTSFSKPVNVVVGKAINEWERVRPAYQPRLLDKKTNELVDFLFCYRGHPIARDYLNNTLIPILCKRAGLPRADERGTITSHRARATLATLLYNAPEGLSLFELMKWLGHTNPATTQQYTRIKPTKLAAAYSKAERTSRLIEARVETKADEEGNVKIYYVLGDPGWCSNADWASCLYRMSCIKCPFFVPKEQAQLIEARATMKRFLEVVNLTPEEIAAAQEDLDKLDETLERTREQPRPTVLRQRAKGSRQRGIPLAVLNLEKETIGD
jgi:integrase